MNNEWFDRLNDLISADSRSYRQLSEAAQCGPNFVQQLMKDRKDPRTSQFSRLLNALGPNASIYVITGLDLSSDDIDFLKVISSLDQDSREAALAILKRLAISSVAELPTSSDPYQATPTNKESQ